MISVIYDEQKPLIRRIISEEECEKLIQTIPDIKLIETTDKLIESEYKKLFSTGKLEDLIKIIKTTYIRNNNRLLNHKKIGEKDENYFNKAENILYSELSISLGKNYEETKNYIIQKVED